MGKKIKAVIFDQDGLMFDTERLMAQAWMVVGKEQGFDVDEAFLSATRGMNHENTKVCFEERYGTSYDFYAVRARKKELFMEIVETKGLPVKPGLKELLVYLKENGYKTALATAARKWYAERNLKEADIEAYFDFIICGDMVTHAKPNPEIFLKAAESLGLEPADCMVLEDSLNGVEAGIRGGFMTVMVPDMTQPDDALRARLDAVCTSLFDVKDMLQNGVEHDSNHDYSDNGSGSSRLSETVTV